MSVFTKDTLRRALVDLRPPTVRQVWVSARAPSGHLLELEEKGWLLIHPDDWAELEASVQRMDVDDDITGFRLRLWGIPVGHVMPGSETDWEIEEEIRRVVRSVNADAWDRLREALGHYTAGAE